MGSGGVAIAALPTVICLKVPFSDGLGGELLPIPIEVHDGCWIGANSTILPGSVIEKGCVIAAGSVVKGLLKPNRLYAGVPAKEIRQLE